MFRRSEVKGRICCFFVALAILLNTACRHEPVYTPLALWNAKLGNLREGHHLSSDGAWKRIRLRGVVSRTRQRDTTADQELFFDVDRHSIWNNIRLQGAIDASLRRGEDSSTFAPGHEVTLDCQFVMAAMPYVYANDCVSLK